MAKEKIKQKDTGVTWNRIGETCFLSMMVLGMQLIFSTKFKSTGVMMFLAGATFYLWSEK